MAAVDEQLAFIKAGQDVPAKTEFFFNPPGKLIQIASAVLDARFATESDRAITLWRQAVALQDALNYDEPPPWYYPIRESLGAALLRSNHVAEAEGVFREDLRRNPRHPWALFGLWQSLNLQGKTADAEWVQKQFEEVWKNANVKLRIEDF